MNKQEKKEFLSNDLIARMIRLEQRVSASFGEVVPYNKTKYYLNLTESEKKSFNQYLHSKLGSKFVLSSLLGLFIFLGFFAKGVLTGNVVGSTRNMQYGGIIVAIFALIGFIIFMIYKLHKRRREKMFESVLNLFDRSIKKRKNRNI
jgi:hypothetical protein